MKLIKKHILLICICLLGITFRFYNLNWDQNQHLHPDERFLTMVTQGITWPSGIAGYFDTRTSPLNPGNSGFPFYVYGTLPLFLIKAVSQVLGMASYDGITLVGRFISAFLDSLIILVLYRLTLLISKSRIAALFGAFTYAVSVLPVQLAHYYAVDTYLTFFLVLSFYFIIRLFDTKDYGRQMLFSGISGLIYGLALSSKITALLFLPVFLAGFLYLLCKTRNIKHIFLLGVVFSVSFLCFLRILQPYMFTGPFRINSDFITNLQTLKSYEDPGGWFPPGVQWIKSVPIIFPLENMVYWGLGPFLGLLGLVSVLFALKEIRRYPLLFLAVLWVIGLFIYQGVQFAKPMRYFYPVYPFISLLTGVMLPKIWSQIKPFALRLLFLFLFLYWPFSFISIYAYPHTRVQATDWILKNIPAGSTLSCEYWDDCLPLGGSGPYKMVEFHLYDSESTQKWADMSAKLLQVDYIILSSNRLYGSIMTFPEKYPSTDKFYQDLFSGKLGFVPVAQFTSRPHLPLPGLKMCLTPPFINYGKIATGIQDCPLPGISFVDDYADESLTVYDHPKVIIFQKTRTHIP